MPAGIVSTPTDPAGGREAADVWWNRPFRMFQTNLREIDAGLDVEKTLDFIEDYGADAWLLNVGGIVSNYPTALPHQRRNPTLHARDSGDLVGDALAAAHRRGIRLLARMDFSKVSREVAEAHPEWCYLAPDGSMQEDNGLTSVCPNGGYYQDKVIEVLEEILDLYRIDGFFFNRMGFNEVDYAKRYRGVCQCLSCRTTFGPDFDDRLPTGRDSPGYQRWQELTRSRLESLLDRAHTAITTRRPDIPLIRRDLVFHEANNAVGRQLWPHLTSEAVSIGRTQQPPRPVFVNAVAFLDMPFRMVGEQPRLFEQYLVQAMARGGVPCTYIMGTPDEFPYDCLSAGAALTRFHRDHQDVYTDLAPSARTALVRSDPLKPGGPDRAAAEAEFRGTWTAMLERHIPFDVVAEDQLAELILSGELNRYTLVVLPDLGAFDNDTAQALDAWVEAGGSLLLTGSSGLHGQRSQLSSSGVAERLVIRDTPETTWSSAVVDGDTPLPVLGAFHVVRSRPEASSELTMLSRAPYGPPEKCYGHLELDHPVALLYKYGRGTTAALTWTPGRAYREVGLDAIGELIARTAVDLLGDSLDLNTDLPTQVEVVVGRSSRGTIVHLRNLSGLRHQTFGDPIPIAGGHTLTLRGAAGATVQTLVSTAEPTVETDGRDLRVQLPHIDLFEVLVISS
ncbi:alpha-amylase family protein [Saccharomonospora sp. NPDC046836]|uniref:alpha-amylase family protein n=1 Tax=Saccharomonospora sp. NPDC046836 TaxID=3156921 RepID=UPI0033EF661C